ncbi:hypothetical protein L915_02860 [Phytophthora nicotianae]|uniref:Uncharacterized protein n=1 Tax=Phytophthora nicotianae TaxID=4792 RepID=W2HHS8_PHYNI|nr:hypothetical protein L915_02860 [Phytophthora nicotianae]
MGSLCPANFHKYIPLQVDPLNAKGSQLAIFKIITRSLFAMELAIFDHCP